MATKATRKNSPLPLLRITMAETLRRWTPSAVRWLPVAGLLLLLGGCLPPRADFEWGLGTTEIVGEVEAGERPARGNPPLLVVYRHHYKFVEMADRPALTHPTVAVVPVPPDGRFRVPMPADVVAVEILFIAPDRLTDEFRFRRQIGLGRITYRAVLRPMPGWHDHFYTYLQPQLAHLITEERYRMTPADQLVLGEWLRSEERRLDGAAEARRRAREAPPAATP